jgi:TRAP-type C4-dicarboxylate transport system substrate-binding protein
MPEPKKTKDKKKEIKSLKPMPPLESKLDKEQELERLLKDEEDAAYERLKKQGMSDQGIVNREQLVDFGKDVYKNMKSNAKKVGEKVGEGVSKLVEKVKEKLK